MTEGSKNCGAEMVARASQQQLGPLLPRVGDVAHDLVDRLLVDQRAHVHALGEAVGHLERVTRSVKPARKSS